MTRWLIATLIAGQILGGCALPGSFSALDKEQIEAMAKIKDAAIMCVAGNYSIGRGLAVFASVDKGISAEVTVDGDCAKVKIQTTVGSPK